MEAGDVGAAARLLIEGIYELPPGGRDGLPLDVRGMQFDSARTLPLTWNAPDWELTCEMLGQIDTPAPVAHGGNGNAFWATIADGMAECLPRAELPTLPGAKHDGPASDPAGFVRLVEAVVAGH